MAEETKRETTTRRVTDSLLAWDKAPMHVRVMAAAYVEPILEALAGLNREVQTITTDLEDLKAHRYGH